MTAKEFSFEEEVICGHTVTSSDKKLWHIELDLASQLDRICEKHGLTYFASGGTLLGAIRHQGFIPWDDDMDFFMPLEDYEKFSAIAPSELDVPYAFTTSPVLARIRNGATTGCTKTELARSIQPKNLGIFIDIFPMIPVPDGKLATRVFGIKIALLKAAYNGKGMYEVQQQYGKVPWRTLLNPRVILYGISKLLHVDLPKAQRALMATYANTDTECVGIPWVEPFSPGLRWNRDLFSSTIRVPFEHVNIPIPQAYDPVLRQQYGDYTVPVKGDIYHSLALCDTETSYLDYLPEIERIQREQLQ